MTLCLSVCLSVVRRCSIKIAKHVITQKSHTIAGDTIFSKPKTLTKSQRVERGHSNGGAKQVMLDEIGDF